MRKPQGWRNEPARHSLAARGVRSGYVPPKYRKEGYEVYLNGVYQGFTKDLEEAKVYADQIGGRVVGSKNRRKILYSAKGVSSQEITEKEAFEFAEGGGAYPRGFVDDVNSQWDILTDRFSFSHYDEEEENTVRQQIKEIRKEWKRMGYKVRTKTIGFSDLARSSTIKIMGIKPRK